VEDPIRKLAQSILIFLTLLQPSLAALPNLEQKPPGYREDLRDSDAGASYGDDLADPEAVNRYNHYFWMGVFGVFFGGVGIFIFYARSKKKRDQALEKPKKPSAKKHKRTKEFIPQTFKATASLSDELPFFKDSEDSAKTNVSARLPTSEANATSDTATRKAMALQLLSNASAKDVKVAPHMREQISGILSGVKSIKSEAANSQTNAISDEEFRRRLQIQEAFSDPIVTEIKTEGGERQGRFSHMTVDASLVFEAGDFPPRVRPQQQLRQDPGEDFEKTREFRSPFAKAPGKKEGL